MFKVETLENVRLNDYARFIGTTEIDLIRESAEKIKGLSVTHVNSTPLGGGVAEILQNMVPLMRDVGLNARWEVMEGSFEFFSVTKKIHNALQGMNIHLTPRDEEIYTEYNRKNGESCEIDSDIVLIHDNQPAAMINYQPMRKGKWIWRCHIDLSTPNLAVWNFLSNSINSYDAAIFTMDKYVVPGLAVPNVEIVPPSINPLNDKNREIPEDQIKKTLERYGVNPEKPIITQVGRFDPWKDPLGAIDVYKQVKKEIPDLQLLLISSMALDDPEGWLYLEKTARHSGEDQDIHILTDLHGVKNQEVNAFQRASNVMLQMSTREGFGLTVTESLWKGVPVVARGVGGIPLQVINETNGYLVNTVGEAAEKISYLLKHPEEAKRMGDQGKLHIQRNFLITKHLNRHLKIYADLLHRAGSTTGS
jgi:trehalose synthase